MVPLPVQTRHSSRLVYILLSAATQHVPRLLHRAAAGVFSGGSLSALFAPNDYGGDKLNNFKSNQFQYSDLVRRTERFDKHDTKSIVFVVLIPVLVLSSGLFAGLTLGYMSLDETQLNVLSISGTACVSSPFLFSSLPPPLPPLCVCRWASRAAEVVVKFGMID